jgi:hypothetical protein
MINERKNVGEIDTQIKRLSNKLTCVSTANYRRKLLSSLCGVKYNTLEPLKFQSGNENLIREFKVKRDRAIYLLTDLITHLDNICKANKDYLNEQRQMLKDERRLIKKNNRIFKKLTGVKSKTTVNPVIEVIELEDKDDMCTHTLFDPTDISINDLNVQIDDIDISIFDTC